nr:ThuA domain-containing protein [Verrucomicrobium spinosum]
MYSPGMFKKLIAPLTLLAVVAAMAFSASTPPKRKILFFTKSSGFEHSVISWKKGQPSHAEGVLTELGKKNNWEFTYSKDGSLFSKDYLAQFDAVFFYTSGDLTTPGTDGQPALTAEGKQALFDYVRSGKGFLGTHSASDTFHTDNESKKGPERFRNHGDKADPYVRFLGAEFIKHGAQQPAKITVTNPKFPGFENVGKEYNFPEEWYSLKDFTPDIHVLSTIDSTSMKGDEYKRPAFPITWHARKAKAASGTPPWATVKTSGPIPSSRTSWLAASNGHWVM